jgi:hypothetical protein
MGLKKRKLGNEVGIFNAELKCTFLFAESVVEAICVCVSEAFFVTKEYKNENRHC